MGHLYWYILNLRSSSFCVNICKSGSYAGLPKACNFSSVSKMLTESWWSSRWLHRVPVWEAHIHLVRGLKCLAFCAQCLLLNRREANTAPLSQPTVNLSLSHLFMNLTESAWVEEVYTVCREMSVLTPEAQSGKLWKSRSSTEGPWGYWELVLLSWIQS